MSYNKKTAFWSACAGMLLFGIIMITLGSVASDLRVKLQLTELASGALFSVLPIGIIAGSLVFGPVVDRYGYRILLALSMVFLFAGFEGLAFTRSAGMLNFFILLIGFGGGAVNGATNALVSDISEKGKGANISLLGVFYGLGALGMPLILGLLRNITRFEVVVSVVGVMALAAGIFYALIKYPPPKQAKSEPLSASLSLVKDKILMLIALFLCFQSGFEGIINNWTTTYLIQHLAVGEDTALFALSAFVAGIVVMRLLIGSILRPLSQRVLLMISMGLILLGLVILKFSLSFNLSVAGLVILGSGLAAGFPVMLGFVGELYPRLSGTAFSLVFFIALIGNTIINFLMGIVAQKFGVEHLITFALAENIIMILLTFVILKRKGKTEYSPK